MMTKFVRENGSWLVAPIVVVAILVAAYEIFFSQSLQVISCPIVF